MRKEGDSGSDNNKQQKCISAVVAALSPFPPAEYISKFIRLLCHEKGEGGFEVSLPRHNVPEGLSKSASFGMHE